MTNILLNTRVLIFLYIPTYIVYLTTNNGMKIDYFGLVLNHFIQIWGQKGIHFNRFTYSIANVEQKNCSIEKKYAFKK